MTTGTFVLLLLEAFIYAATAIQAERSRVEFTDTEGDNVEIRLEDGCLNLYGGGELAISCMKDVYIDSNGRTMDFANTDGDEASTTVPLGQEAIVEDIKAIFDTANAEGSLQLPVTAKDDEEQEEGEEDEQHEEEHESTSSGSEEVKGRATVVEYIDTEGDTVKLQREGNCVQLYSSNELVDRCLQRFEVRADGRTLDLFSDTEDAAAWSTVPVGQEEVVQVVRALFKDLTAEQQEETSVEEETSHLVQQQLLSDMEAVKLSRIVRRQTSEMWIFAEGDKSAPGSRLPESNAFPDISSSVLLLNPVTFEANVLQEHGTTTRWIVLFCYDWWEHCQKIAEPYAQLGDTWQKELNTGDFQREVRFARVNCATDRVLCNEQGVTGLPNVQHYSKGGRVSKWSGGREKDAAVLEKWIKKQLSGEVLASEEQSAGLHSVRMSFSALGVEGFTSVFLILVSIVGFVYRQGA